jgi:hypothetical protein
VLQGQLAHRVSKALLALQDRKVFRVKLVLLALKALLAPRVRKVFKAQPAQQDRKVFKVISAQRDRKAFRVFRESKASKARPDRQVHSDQQVFKARLARQALLVQVCSTSTVVFRTACTAALIQ